MAEVGNLADWRGKQLFDRHGDKLGKFEDVYVDVETDEPVFGTVKEGFIGHLTFMPLHAAVASPDGLQLGVSREQVQDAPNIEAAGGQTRSRMSPGSSTRSKDKDASEASATRTAPQSRHGRP
jgi:hypothetical protein